MPDKAFDAKDFALAVVSGNPVEGSTPEEKAANALKLYIAAKAAVKEHNVQIGTPKAQVRDLR